MAWARLAAVRQGLYGSTPGVVDALAAKGVVFRGSGGEGSGLHGVMVTPQGLQGGADERREGVVKGF